MLYAKMFLFFLVSLGFLEQPAASWLSEMDEPRPAPVPMTPATRLLRGSSSSTGGAHPHPYYQLPTAAVPMTRGSTARGVVCVSDQVPTYAPHAEDLQPSQSSSSYENRRMRNTAKARAGLEALNTHDPAPVPMTQRVSSAGERYNRIPTYHVQPDPTTRRNTAAGAVQATLGTIHPAPRGQGSSLLAERVRSMEVVNPDAAAPNRDHHHPTGAFRLAPLNDDFLDGQLMLKRPAKWGMCVTRARFLATIMPLGMFGLWYEQLTGHKQTAYIMAAMADWWRLTNVGTVGLWREGSVLTAGEMGMEPVGVTNASAWMGSASGSVGGGGAGMGAWTAFATNVLEKVSVPELVYQHAEFFNKPTLRFLDADVKTLKDVGASLGTDGFASQDSCFAGELVAKTGGWRNTFVLPEVYHGGSAVGISTSVPTGILDSCVLGEIAFNPALAYRYGVASLVAVLEQAHLHEQLDRSENHHDRPVASIETVAKTLGVFDTELYQNLPQGLKTRASLLQLAKTGNAIFTNLNLAQFVLVMILAHGTDPLGVGSNWYLREYLRALVPEVLHARVIHFLLPKLNLAVRRYTKLTPGVEVRIRFPGGQPGDQDNSWLQDRDHMAPGYPFTPLEAEAFFPNFVPNEIWATGVVERVENGGAVPKVHVRVRKSCDEQRPGHDDLESAIPSKAVPSDLFPCPKPDVSVYPGVTVTGGASATVHENMLISITGEQTIAEMVRSPVEQHVAVLEAGPFAQLKQINSLDLETSVDDKVNAGKDVRVGAEEMVLADILTVEGSYSNGQHLLYTPEPKTFWGRITEQLHKGMAKTQQKGSRSTTQARGNDELRPSHRVLDVGEMWMNIWGIPYNLASDKGGEILKLNIADVDKAAAVAAVIDAAIVGLVGVWGGSAEVMRLAARLGIELSLGLFVKGFAQDDMTRMDSAGYWICNDRMEIAGSGDQGSLQGMTWAKIASEEHLGVQNIKQIKYGARRLDSEIDPEIQQGTVDQGTEQEIAALPVSTTTFRNCGDMAVSGHTNVVLFSRLFWIDFLHTSFAQQHILKNFFRLFFMMSAAGQWAVNGLGRRMRGKRSGEESLDNAWKWTLAELYWYEEKTTVQNGGSNWTRSLSRLDLILKTWEGHLQYFLKVFHDTEHKEEIRGPASWFDRGHRGQEIALRLRQKIKQTEKDIEVLKSVVEKLDAYFRVSATVKQKSGDTFVEGMGQSLRQNWIGSALKRKGLDVVRRDDCCAGGQPRTWYARAGPGLCCPGEDGTWDWEDREVVTAIAGLLWEGEQGAGGAPSETQNVPRWRSTEIVELGRRPTNDAAWRESLRGEMAGVGLLRVHGTLEREDTSGSTASSASTAPSSIPVDEESGLVRPSDVSDFTFVRCDKIAWPAEGMVQVNNLTPIYISAGSASRVLGSASSSSSSSGDTNATTSDQFSTLHAAFLTAAWSKYGAMFLRITSFLLLQFFVVPSIITGEWYIIKSWFHWPRDTVESLIYASVIKSVWWGIDLYANFRLTREMLILEEVGERLKGGEAQRGASMGTFARDGVPAMASTGSMSPTSNADTDDAPTFLQEVQEFFHTPEQDPNLWTLEEHNRKRKENLIARDQHKNNPGHDLSYAGGRQILLENEIGLCPPRVSNPNPIVAGARWLAEREAHAGAADALAETEDVGAEEGQTGEDEETGGFLAREGILPREEEETETEEETEDDGAGGGGSSVRRAAVALLGCAKAAGIRAWNSSLWAPVENDATGTLPGICVKDGLQLAAVLGITARIYIPVLMGADFLTTPGSNGVFGAQ